MNEETELLIAYLHGELPPDRVIELEARLKEDADLRRSLLELATEESELEEWAQTEHAFQPAEKVLSFPVSRWLAIAACLALALVVWWGNSYRQAYLELTSVRPTPAPAQTSPPAAMGLLVDEAAAAFADHAAPAGVQFDAGEYELTNGTAHMRLMNGVDLVFRAPIRFRLLDVMNLELIDGSLRAAVPPNAQGFTVKVPEMDFEDLGTEFGVKVNAKTRRSELHVFDGEVRVKKSGEANELASVQIGEAVHVENGSLKRERVRDSDAFPRAAEIGFQRWKIWSQTVRKDPDLLLYYSFERDGSGVTLPDVSVGTGKVEGVIRNARWVTGRWEGKQALLFDRDGDSVDLEIPGELNTFTFAAWVKQDRMNIGLIPVLNSIGWETGDVHLQIGRRRNRFSVGVSPGSIVTDHPAEMKLGQWVHLAAVVDMEKRIARTYINGELSVEKMPPAGITLSPGKCRLGAWVAAAGIRPRVRGFRGRIDEVVIWRRTLDEDELKQLIVNGRPNVLWPDNQLAQLN